MSMPKVVYIYEEQSGDDKYLVAMADPTEISETQVGAIGVYDFRESLHVRSQTQFRRPKSKEWTAKLP